MFKLLLVCLFAYLAVADNVLEEREAHYYVKCLNPNKCNGTTPVCTRCGGVDKCWSQFPCSNPIYWYSVFLFSRYDKCCDSHSNSLCWLFLRDCCVDECPWVCQSGYYCSQCMIPKRTKLIYLNSNIISNLQHLLQIKQHRHLCWFSSWSLYFRMRCCHHLLLRSKVCYLLLWIFHSY